MSEIRYDILHDTDVIIAPERLHRADSYKIKTKKKTDKKDCPFCEGNEFMTPPEIFAIRDAHSTANKASWKTRVVPNLYKALQIETPYQHHHKSFECWDGFGAHEVIIDTPKHYTSLTQWDLQTAYDWLKTLAQRVGDLRHDNRIVYISLFKNEGIDAGATQEHCHTQLIGMPVVPKIYQNIYHRSEKFFRNTQKAILEDMILKEQEDSSRIVQHYGEFTAFCPFASAYPFEVIISSQKDLGQIDTLSDESMQSVSALLLDVMQRLSKQVTYLHYNLSILTPPLHKELDDKAFRFAIRIMPHIYTLGGFEISTGVNINPVSPELAAELLRGSDES